MNISLPSIVIVGFVAAIAAIACAVYFASQNSASSTIVLSAAAFCGTLVILILQSWVELQSDETADSVSAEYTLDRSKPEIASAFYSDENPGFIRGIYEQEASNDYFAKHPEALNDKTAALGQEKAQNLGQDMALYSFIVMLFNYQYDWQIRPVRLRARYAIGYETSVGLSRPDECSMVSSKHLNELLAAVENRFAEGVFDRSRKEICLPPNSRITVSSRAVTLSSPLYTMEFKFASPDLMGDFRTS